MTGSEYPDLAHERLLEAGWELTGKRRERLLQLPAVEVVGHTLLYRDPQLQAAMEAAGLGSVFDPADDGRLVTGGEESPWRFFFATALSFTPPLPPGIGPAAVLSTVASRARRTFAAELEGRGFEAVETEGGQRIRTEAGDRARLRKFTARFPIPEGPPERIDAEGWLAVWSADGGLRIAGGAYPVSGLAAAFDESPAGDRPPIDRDRFREELIGAIRSVG